jgi:hypothetical protein
MIFAELEEAPEIEDLIEVLESNFGLVEWGDQGSPGQPDAYFGVSRDDVMVAVDNLTSMKFQVKCNRPDNPLLQEVLGVLADSYRMKIYAKPELEAHED